MADGSVKIDVGLNIGKAEKDLAKLIDKINKAEDALNSNASRKTELEKQIAQVGAQADEAKRRVIELKEQLNNTRSRDEKASIRAELAEATEEQRILTRESNRLNDEYVQVNQKIMQGTADLTEMREEAGQLTEQIERARPGEVLANSIDTAKKSLMKFLKYAIGIRSIYFLFRRLRSAIKDAVKSFAEYDEETKLNLKTMEATKTAIKTALGEGLASIYNAILPVVQKIANWMLEAANAASKFIAILSGKGSYKKVVVDTDEIAASMEDVSEEEKEASEEAKKLKKQLMGFDELNILSKDEDKNQNNKGKTDKTAQDGIETIEEAIDPFDDSKLATIARFIKDHLREIKDLALAIGAAFATWKIADLANKLLGLGLSMSQLAGAALGVGGSILYVKGFLDAWKNGLDNGNLTEMILGAAAAIVGFGLALGPVGAGIAALVTGLGLAAVGFKEWAETGEMSTQTLIAIDTGIGLVGLALSLLTGSWIPLAIAAVAGLLFSLPEILGGLSNFFYSIGMDNLGEWFAGMSEKAEKAREWLRTKVVEPVCNYISNAFEEWNTGEHKGEYKDTASWFICGVLGLPTDEEWKQWGIDAINWLGEGFFDLADTLHLIIGAPLEEFFEEDIPKAWQWFKDFGPKAIEWLWEGFLDFTEEIHNIIGAPLETFFEEDIPQLIETFKEFGPKAIEWLKEGFENFKQEIHDTITAPIESLFEEVIPGLWDKFLEWWNNISLPEISFKMPHISWETQPVDGWIADVLSFLNMPLELPKMHVDWYAKGGVFDMPRLIGVGENGKEAVVPLERNTGWMQMVADGLMERFERADFANKLADAFMNTPRPAMAGGGIVPPRAINGGSMFTDSDIDRIVRGLSAVLGSAGGRQEIINKIYLDGKQIADSTTKWQRIEDRAKG